MVRRFDRKNKITNEQFRDQAIEIFGRDAAQEGLSKIAQLLVAKGVDSLPKLSHRILQLKSCR